MNAINTAREAMLRIWPRGPECEHADARIVFEALDDATKREAELAEALSAMCHQYLRVEHGKLHHDFMSAGEAAFDALDWPDSGQPLDASCLCEVPGCGEGWTCGANGKDEKYHTLCSAHFREWIDAGHHETEEQHDARLTNDLIKSGMSLDEVAAHKAANKADREGWEKLRQKMPDGTAIDQQSSETEGKE